jgi:hypothetical protein
MATYSRPADLCFEVVLKALVDPLRDAAISTLRLFGYPLSFALALV